MPSGSRRWAAAVAAAVLAAAAFLGAVTRSMAEPPSALEFREIAGGRLAESGTAIPREAARVSLYLGDAARACVTDKNVAVDYGLGTYGGAGVLFDRASGAAVERRTVLDGWPRVRPETFGPPPAPRPKVRLGGPGMVQVWGEMRREGSSTVAAAEARWGGRSWRALQPADFHNRISRAGYEDRQNTSLQSWSGILTRLNEECYVEAAGANGESKRYTMADGLPSNIVTRFAAGGDSLWAACADIYDPEKKAWGPGGLARYDAEKNRWERVETIDGRPVRWVTLLEVHGDDLWVGFREGDGIEGDRIWYGMGIGVGLYRPKATAVVLARLSGGKWKAWGREPLAEGAGPYGQPPSAAPTEMPQALARLGNRVFLYSGVGGPLPSYSFDYQLTGRVSALDLNSGAWRTFDNEKDVGQDLLNEMVAERGEVLLLGNRGASRWDAKAEAWRFLDPGGELKNPMMSAAAAVGDQLWVGYTNQSFGVLGEQGISVFDEKKHRWSYIPPAEIGTSCPVRRMIALPGGDVWVFFMPRPWGGAALECPLIRRETRPAIPTAWGVGLFSGGKWTFPIAIGPKQAGEEPMTGVYNAWDTSGMPRDVVAVGDRLYALLADGLYAGPGQWKCVLKGEFTRLRLAPGGKTVQLFRSVRKEGGKIDYERIDYDPATGKSTVTPSDVDEVQNYVDEVQNWYVFDAGETLWDRHGPDTTWIGDWTQVPTRREGLWTVGPLESGYHAVIETPHALWIASEGQLLRLDRARLKEWLGK